MHNRFGWQRECVFGLGDVFAMFVMTRRTYRGCPDTGLFTGFDRSALLVPLFVPRTVLGFGFGFFAGFDNLVTGLGCWLVQGTFSQINHLGSHNRRGLFNLYWHHCSRLWCRLILFLGGLAFAALLLGLHFGCLTCRQFYMRACFLLTRSQFMLINNLGGFTLLGCSHSFSGCGRCNSNFSGSSRR